MRTHHTPHAQPFPELLERTQALLRQNPAMQAPHLRKSLNLGPYLARALLAAARQVALAEHTDR